MGKRKNIDKYGVDRDSHSYIDQASVASSTDHTGMVPVAMESEYEKESYNAMFNVPVGDVSHKKSMDALRKKKK